MTARARLLLFAAGWGVSHALHAGPAALRPPGSVARRPALAEPVWLRRTVAPHVTRCAQKGGEERVRRTGRADRGAWTMRVQGLSI